MRSSLRGKGLGSLGEPPQGTEGGGQGESLGAAQRVPGAARVGRIRSPPQRAPPGRAELSPSPSRGRSWPPTTFRGSGPPTAHPSRAEAGSWGAGARQDPASCRAPPDPRPWSRAAMLRLEEPNPPGSTDRFSAPTTPRGCRRRGAAPSLPASRSGLLAIPAASDGAVAAPGSLPRGTCGRADRSRPVCSRRRGGVTGFYLFFPWFIPRCRGSGSLSAPPQGGCSGCHPVSAEPLLPSPEPGGLQWVISGTVVAGEDEPRPDPGRVGQGSISRGFAGLGAGCAEAAACTKIPPALRGGG